MAHELKHLLVVLGAAALAWSSPAGADPNPAFGAQILKLAARWDHAAYEMPNKKAELAELDLVVNDADALAAKNPARAEPLLWKGMALATKADASVALRALSFAKEARKVLESAEALAPGTKRDGLLPALLGTLYANVPPAPIGFGDLERAETYLKDAVSLNPDGIDENYFYGDFLMDRRRTKEAIVVLEHGLKAQPRPGRAVGDAGRRRDIEDLLREALGTTPK